MKRCKICGGTGVIYDRNFKVGSHGELRVCDCIERQCNCGARPPYQVFTENGEHSWCHCRKARLRLEKTKKAFRESQVPKKYLWKFLEDFEIVSPEVDKIITFSTIKDMTPDEKWKKGIYLWGPAGSGKTLLACICLQELILKYAQSGRFVDISRQFFQRLKSSYNSTDESFGTAGQILDDLIEVPFLVIDDFGTQRNTDWELEMLYNLIDSRYEDERVTIITSNIIINKYKDEDDMGSFLNPPQEMGKGLGKKAKIEKGIKDNPVMIAKLRIYSRILEMCQIIHVNLPDYREKFSQYI